MSPENTHIEKQPLPGTDAVALPEWTARAVQAQAKANEAKSMLTGAVGQGSSAELLTLSNQLGGTIADCISRGLLDLVGRLQAMQSELAQISTQVEQKLKVQHTLVETTGSLNATLVNEVMSLYNPATHGETQKATDIVLTRHHIPHLILFQKEAREAS